MSEKQKSLSSTVLKWLAEYWVDDVTDPYRKRCMALMAALVVGLHHATPPKDRNWAVMTPPGSSLPAPSLRITMTAGPTGPSVHMSAGTAVFHLSGGPTGPSGPMWTF
jgi:hypothetical protein